MIFITVGLRIQPNSNVYQADHVRTCLPDNQYSCRQRKLSRRRGKRCDGDYTLTQVQSVNRSVQVQANFTAAECYAVMNSFNKLVSHHHNCPDPCTLDRLLTDLQASDTLLDLIFVGTTNLISSKPHNHPCTSTWRPTPDSNLTPPALAPPPPPPPPDHFLGLSLYPFIALT